MKKTKAPAFVLDPTTSLEAYISIDEIEPGSPLARACVRREAAAYVANQPSEHLRSLKDPAFERLQQITRFLRVDQP